MAKKKKGPIIKKGLDDWMATYADMVTLLFCFFVMLYSASNQDEARFQYILQAFNTQGRFVNTIVGRPPEPPLEPSGNDGNTHIPPLTPGDDIGNHPGDTNQPQMFDALYSTLADIIDEEGLTGVQIFSRPGMIRVVLEGDVVFDPDSYALNQAGRHVLNVLSPAVRAVQEWVRSVEVQGHTAATALPAFGINDWDLSVLRASTVVQYLDGETRMVESNKFMAKGYAQHLPAADNTTPEGRASNRRVEMIINRVELTEEENRFVDDIMRHDFNNPIFDVDAVGAPLAEPGAPVESIVTSILSDLNERYGANEAPAPGYYSGTQIGPGIGGFGHLTEADFAPIDPNAPPTPEPNGENGNGENGEAEE